MKVYKVLSDIALALAEERPFGERMGTALAAIGETLGVSRVYVFQDSEDGTRTSNAYEWRSPGAASRDAPPKDLPYEDAPSWRRLLETEGRILAGDVAALPEDLRRILEPQGIKSLLAYPLRVEGRIGGFIGFDDRERRRDWDDIELRVLEIASGILSAVYGREVARKCLESSEEDFRRFFDTVDDLIVIGKLDGSILYANEAVRHKLGYSGEEIVAMGFPGLFSPEFRAEAEALVQAALRRERDACSLKVRRKSGGELPVETKAWLGKWHGVDCVYSVSKDLGPLEAALYRFKKLFDNNPALIAITDTRTMAFTDVNEAFLRKLGYAREEVVGRTSEEIGLYRDHVQRRRISEELAREGRIKDVELAARGKDGRELDGLFSGEVIDIQGEKSFLTVMVDISEQIELRKRLEAQRRRLRSIIDAARLGTWEWNVTTGETVFNERWAEIVGYSLSELEPVSIATWERLVHPDDLAESRRLLQLHFEGKSDFYECESRMRRRDGTWAWVLDRGRVVEWDSEGAPLRMSGTHTDISQFKELQERLRLASIHDPLTAVYNRRHAFERLEEVAAEHSRRGETFSVSIIDLDRFAEINDRYGHLAGDFVLRELASMLEASVRPYDIVGRYAGQQFIVVSPGADARSTIGMIAGILELVRAGSYTYAGKKIGLTFSCGVADSSEAEGVGASAEAIVAAADRRLKEAKEGGRDRVAGPESIAVG